jgi:hypothetical protein
MQLEIVESLMKNKLKIMNKEVVAAFFLQVLNFL